MTFAEKFEKALSEKKDADETYGLRTLARKMAKDDPRQAEIIRRRLHKYRPKNGGGAAEVAPSAPTRWEIEDAMGLERDALAPERKSAAAKAKATRFADTLDEILRARAVEVFEEELARRTQAVAA